MDSEVVNSTSKKQVDKLNRITKRIQKTRKDNKIAEKEAEEFKEIQKLLQSNDDDLPIGSSTESLPEELQSLDGNVIPMKFPGVKVFHSELIFSLFEEHNCLLENFITKKEDYGLFSDGKSVPTEECIRKLISYRTAEALLPEEGKCSSVSLYILYLMSVHQDANFVASCFDFLKHHNFSLQLEDIFTIFSNFGAKCEDLFDFSRESFIRKFPGEKNDKHARGTSAKTRFPFYNLEMVGRILLQYIDENLLVIDPTVESFVRGLVKITLDPKIRSGALLPLYSTILTALCSRLRKDFGPEVVLRWLHSGEEHLLNQLEVSQSVLKPMCTDLHDGLVLKILSEILGSKLLPAKPPLKINHVKAALKKSYQRELLPLELYSLLQLINGTLPGLTATTKHSAEINGLLACLEQKISQVEDPVDLMRLKLEIAKVGNLVTNNISNRFAVQEVVTKCSAKKGVGFFILPLGFGSKRLEFFQNQVRKFGGTLNGDAVTHVVVEDSVSGEKKNCLSGLKTCGFEGRRDVKYVRVKWVSNCIKCKRLTDTRPFEIEWLRDEVERSSPPEGESAREDCGESPEKKQKMEDENEKYTCSKPSSSKYGGTPQKIRIVEELEKLMNAYNIRKDTWRSHGYRKAINAILLYEKDISSFQEACSIPGVGEKMALKIMEIIESGKLEKVDEIIDDKTKVLDAFCKIWGVGPSTAEGWYVQGFRTLEDLSAKAKLTKQQRIGLELYDEFQERIPREEVVKISEVVETEVKKIGGSLSVEVVGSFRRGKATCGDVDFMIVSPGMKSPLDILIQVTEALRIKGYLSHDLVALDDWDIADENHHKKYFGVFKFPGENQTHRRIDLFVVPKSEYASALMHYTGSALFNRSIKLLAAKKNMTLSEHGLYTGSVRKVLPLDQSSASHSTKNEFQSERMLQGSEVTCKGQLIPTLTEMDIFNELGLPYRHPEERDH